jgi:hypothetical protein
MLRILTLVKIQRLRPGLNPRTREYEVVCEGYEHSHKACVQYSLWVSSYKQGNGADP